MHPEIFESRYLIKKEKCVSYVIEIELIDFPVHRLLYTFLFANVIVMRVLAISESILENDETNDRICEPNNHDDFDDIYESITGDQ